MGNAATPTVEITEEDGTYTLKTITTFKTTEIKFKVGEEFEETTADGRTVKVSQCRDRQRTLLCSFNLTAEIVLSLEVVKSVINRGPGHCKVIMGYFNTKARKHVGDPTVGNHGYKYNAKIVIQHPKHHADT